jgi:hypothetical protein
MLERVDKLLAKNVAGSAEKTVGPALCNTFDEVTTLRNLQPCNSFSSMKGQQY